jgi:hypothetical protein
MEQTLEAMEFKQLAKLAGVNQVSPGLKVNGSGYPYVTLYNKSGKWTNIYFSVNSAPIVVNTIGEGNPVKSYLLSVSIAKTINKDGEIRYKFTSPNKRESLFDDEPTTSNFNVEDFVAIFDNQTVTV